MPQPSPISGSGAAARPPKTEERPHLEIQYHPSDIRRGVRYFFLSRRQVTGFWVGVAAFVAFLVCSFWILPSVVGDQLAKAAYAEEAERRQQLGESLKTLVGRLAELETASDEVRWQMSKIYLAYGFSEEEARGKGGYPYEPEKVPQSIFAATIRQGNGLNARISEQFAVLETFLEEVQSFEDANRDHVRTTPSISPVRSEDFVLTSPFGNRTSPFTKEADFHAGIDLAAPIGTPVMAPADGVVAFSGRIPLRQSVGWWRYGNLVAVRHGERFITLYGHCDETRVRSGERVRQGQVIATVGETGWSTTPHLHYEVRRRTEEGSFAPIDPRIYILDHRWRDQERLLVRARQAPPATDFEPLPKTLRR